MIGLFHELLFEGELHYGQTLKVRSSYFLRNDGFEGVKLSQTL
jgi:hypothetical protein